jgi:glycolate oxidase FAD binding subunit
MRPVTESELAATIAAGESFEILSHGTKRGLGHPVVAAAVLDLGAFSGVSLYEHDELVLEAQAATPLADIESLLATKHQHLAFEPPDFGPLLGSPARGSLAGSVAAALSGPRRISAGAARDHVLGVTGVSGRGEIFKAGGRVVKNVTGFDVPRLMAGSFGTLAALTRITLKVLPKPEQAVTLVLSGLDDATAIAAMSAAMQSSLDVSGAAHLPGAPAQTLLRLEGIAPSLRYRRDRLASLLRPFGTSDTLEAQASDSAWRDIRDVTPFVTPAERFIWRLSVPPSEGAAVVAHLQRTLDVQHFYDWAGGLIWLSLAPRPDAAASLIRAAVTAGHATLVRAPSEIRQSVPVFQPQPPALAALVRRVRAAFDPACRLNPQRMGQDS